MRNFTKNNMPEDVLRPRKSRLFITENNTDHFQMFSFTQDKDGSLHSNWPDLGKSNFCAVASGKSNIMITSERLDNNGKLTIHGKGRSHIRVNEDDAGHKAIVWGNKLLDLEKNEIGARHILTVFPSKPSFIPSHSPALNRKSDQIINAKGINPLVLIFFAIPQKGVQISLSLGINVDRLENVPDDFLGYGVFPMRMHDLLWCAYRTKGLVWPKVSQAFYTDGYDVPFVLGVEAGKFELEIHRPTYSLVENQFNISVSIIGETIKRG